MSGARRSATTTVGAALLAVLVIGLPLARGGVDLPSLLVAALLAPLAFLLSVRTELRVPLAGLSLAAVLAVTVFQAVPVPAALHGLSPETRRLFEATLSPLGRYPAWRPLSLDVPATARAVATAAVGLSAFCAAWAAGHGRRRRSLVLGALAGGGLAVATVVLVAALMGYTPFLAPRLPFVNPNHLAGFTVLTAFPLLGLALRAHGQLRLLLLLGFLATSTLAFLALSRGGVGAFLAGAALFAVLGLRREGQDARIARGGRLAFSAAVAGSLAFAAFLSLDPLLDKFAALREPGAESKVSLWAPALTMAREHPLLGIGRGAFETTFPGYKTGAEQLTYTHLENEWLQPLAELGFPAGLLLVGTLGWVWLRAARRRDLSWTEVGLLSGTAALAGQNLFDFSLELLGVSVPFMAALGLASRGAGPLTLRRWVVLAVSIALGAISVGGLLLARAFPAEADSAAVANASDATMAVAAARSAAAWRPSDYVPVATAGARLVEEGRCGEALPWLTRAMLLSPTAPEPHLGAAQCLAASNQRTFALREFRLAWTYGGRSAFAEAASWYPDVESLLQVAPDTPHDLMWLGEFLSTRPADAAVVYRKALEDFGEQGALVPLARASRAAGDREGALALVERRLQEQPGDTGARRLAAELVLEAGDEVGAIRLAQAGLERSPGDAALQSFLYDRALAHGRFSEARRLADEIVAHTPAEVASKLQLVARALAAQGRLGEAVEVMRTAAGTLPGSPAAQLALAAYCERAGRYDDAIAAVERAAALPGQAPEAYAERLKALTEAKNAQEARRRLQGLQP